MLHMRPQERRGPYTMLGPEIIWDCEIVLPRFWFHLLTEEAIPRLVLSTELTIRANEVMLPLAISDQI